MTAPSYTDEQLNNIWKSCTDVIRTSVSSVEYDSFISTLSLADIKDETAYLTVPNPFYISVIEKKYHETIKHALIDATKRYLIVQFCEKDKYIKQTYEIDDSVYFESHLNKSFTFDSFVIGKCNRMACAGAQAIAEAPGQAYNPFFIYGSSGLGKTHLMHAIGNEIIARDPKKKVLYVTSEAFTNEFIEALQQRKNEEFRTKYRNIDVLLIDDIQFLSKAERTQEEFFFTFNALHDAGKQIVVSSDCPLNQLDILEDRLRTRFSMGFFADIQPPDYETKVAILNQKAQEKSLDVENEIFDYIATYTGENIRELEGVVNHLSMAIHQGQSITMNLAQEAVSHLTSRDLHEATAGVIIDDVSRYFNISVEDLLSKKRTKELVFPRQIAMYLCRTLIDLSYEEIGKAFNGKDHSTVMYGCEQIAKQVEINNDMQKTLNELKMIISH